MSSMYNSTSTFVDPNSSRDIEDGLGLNHNHFPSTPFDQNLLSPFNNSQTISNSVSPSYTPGESQSDYSNYQQSDGFSDHEDPFFGVNFDAGVIRVDSLPTRPILGNVAYPSADLNRPLPDLPIQDEDKPLSATFSNSTYPLSPIHSSFPNTPSPKVAVNEIKGRTTISQHELTNVLHNARFQGLSVVPPTQAVQLTPDHSGSSRTSTEDLENIAMPTHQQSPRVQISQWGHAPQQNQPSAFVEADQHNVNYNQSAINSNQTQISVPIRDDEGQWRADETTGQGGVSPEARKNMSGAEIPTLREQDAQRRRDNKNIEIEEWTKSQAGDDVGESYFPGNWQQPDSKPQRPQDIDDENIHPLDDTYSLHENRLIEGQIYYDLSKTEISEADKRHMGRPRQWNDAPSLPHITTTHDQPATSNEAIARFCQHSDTMSIASRAATWGTRRRSETNLADLDGIADGSLFKKLSISKSSDRQRNNSIFDQGLDRLASIVRKRSDSKLKRTRSSQNIPEEVNQAANYAQGRHNSQGSLAPPPRTSSFGKNKTPSINTAFAAMAGPLAAVGTTHTRHNSVSQTSPKSPSHLGFTSRIIHRARSKSELSSRDNNGQIGLVGLWRGQGGPPVATLPTKQPQLEVQKPEPQAPEVQDVDDEDDEDDDQADENDMKVESEQEADPIVPNYEGFKAHVHRLNPDMDPRYKWLVSRVAHQQEIRYKNLLDMRVKHSQAINAGNCSAGVHCLSLGGSVTLTDAKGNRRDSSQVQQGLHPIVTDFADDDSNAEDGALTEETFPAGVPLPPTRNLPAEFECQLCFKSKKFQKPSDWTKHVHEDVQPFTCTYDKCKEPKSFKRKADWVRHENERHRHLEWWICQVDDCRHPCYRKDNFLQHLVREHKLPEPKQKTKAAIKKARDTEPAWIMLERCHHETTNRPQDEPCKFCGKNFPTWKKLTVHLAKHMEHISLPILRLVEIKNVDANTIISPVEQILTPVTPVSRTKMESSASPFNMNNVSPHIPMANQFASTGFQQPPYFQTVGPSAGFVMQPPLSQEMYNQNTNVYQNGYNVQQLPQQRGFNQMENNSMNHLVQNRGYGHMDTGFTQPKIEQTRGFEPMDSGFSHPIANQNYNSHPNAAYSMPQSFSSAPATSGYPNPNVMSMNDGYAYDSLAVNGTQNFPQVPMSRAQGSASSYGQSPQNVPFYGHQ